MIMWFYFHYCASSGKLSCPVEFSQTIVPNFSTQQVHVVMRNFLPAVQTCVGNRGNPSDSRFSALAILAMAREKAVISSLTLWLQNQEHLCNILWNHKNMGGGLGVMSLKARTWSFSKTFIVGISLRKIFAKIFCGL